MDKMNKKKEYFPARLPVLIIVACVAVAVLGCIGLGVSVWRLVFFSDKPREVFDIIKDVALLPIGAFCIATPVAILLRSGYTVTEKWLSQSFGFFQTKYDVKDIRTLLLISDSGKLTASLDGQTVAFLLSPDKNEGITRALMKVNPDIEYSFTLAPPETKTE